MRAEAPPIAAQKAVSVVGMKRLDLHGNVVALSAPQEFHAVKSRKPGRPAMDTIGLDLHKRESQLCVIG
ncbi:MAG TPA: hypothetical protein VFK26_04420, partial [Gemmatimonadaceae bacterium]|nr:hypothetical protein [Gemmatimonadaceae bacterium]